MKANYGRRADSDHADDSILRFMLRMPHVIWRMEERKSTEWNKRVHPTHCTIFLPSFVVPLVFLL